MGWAVANLALAAFEFKETHIMFGQWEHALRSIGWGVDWLAKAHITASDTPTANVFVGQVGATHLLGRCLGGAAVAQGAHCTRLRHEETVTSGVASAVAAAAAQHNESFCWPGRCLRHKWAFGAGEKVWQMTVPGRAISSQELAAAVVVCPGMQPPCV